jgi:hypothetical protein
VAGTLRVRTADGAEFDATPGQVTSLPAGHDAWVVGDEEVVVVDWWGASNYARLQSNAVNSCGAPVAARWRGGAPGCIARAGTRPPARGPGMIASDFAFRGISAANGQVMIVGQSGQVPAHTRGGTDISPVRLRNSAWNWGLGVIVGQTRRIAPPLTHDLRSIPYGGITQAVNIS